MEMFVLLSWAIKNKKILLINIFKDYAILLLLNISGALCVSSILDLKIKNKYFNDSELQQMIKETIESPH